MEEIRRAGKGGGPLPLHEDDMADAFGHERPRSAEEGGHHGHGPRHGISFMHLFLTIVVAAPIAAFLVLVVIDLYDPLSKSLGLREEPVSIIPAGAVANTQEEERLAMWIKVIEKNNKALVGSINKQTKAVLKLANKKPAKIKVPPAEVIVVKVPTKERFSLKYEKRKLLDLADLDLDDPVIETSFDSVVSKQVLNEIIRSLNSIIKASKNNSGISSFLKSNALKAKKYAKKRLSKI